MKTKILPVMFGIIVSINCPRNLDAGDHSIRLRMRSGRPVVEDVYLNGHGPYRFLLDTAGQTNQLESEVAGAIGLKAEFRVELATANGKVMVPGGHVEELEIGGTRVSGQEFLLGSLDAVHALDSTIRGVLGQEFLGKFDYLLDVRNRTLSLGMIAPARGSRLPLQTIEGRIAMPTNHGRLILDSGVDTMVLFRRLSGGAMRKTMRTASGTAMASTAEPQRLRIQGCGVREVDTVSVPRPDGVVEDGLLPLNVFRAVYVSNSEKFVVVDPKPGS
jgi:predicted aspartyl protease